MTASELAVWLLRVDLSHSPLTAGNSVGNRRSRPEPAAGGPQMNVEKRTLGALDRGLQFSCRQYQGHRRFAPRCTNVRFSDRHAQEQPTRKCSVLLLVTTFFVLTIVKVATLLEFVGVRYLLARCEYDPARREGGRDVTQALTNAADRICPYAKVTRGNINLSAK